MLVIYIVQSKPVRRGYHRQWQITILHFEMQAAEELSEFGPSSYGTMSDRDWFAGA